MSDGVKTVVCCAVAYETEPENVVRMFFDVDPLKALEDAKNYVKAAEDALLDRMFVVSRCQTHIDLRSEFTEQVFSSLHGDIRVPCGPKNDDFEIVAVGETKWQSLVCFTVCRHDDFNEVLFNSFSEGDSEREIKRARQTAIAFAAEATRLGHPRPKIYRSTVCVSRKIASEEKYRIDAKQPVKAKPAASQPRTKKAA